jgi:hypothetical protein
VKKSIEVFPHLGADFFANLPGVFAGALNALHNGKRPFRICDQQEESMLGVNFVGSDTGCQRGDRVKPTFFPGKLRRIQD